MLQSGYDGLGHRREKLSNLEFLKSLASCLATRHDTKRDSSWDTKHYAECSVQEFTVICSLSPRLKKIASELRSHKRLGLRFMTLLIALSTYKVTV